LAEGLGYPHLALLPSKRGSSLGFVSAVPLQPLQVSVRARVRVRVRVWVRVRVRVRARARARARARLRLSGTAAG